MIHWSLFWLVLFLGLRGSYRGLRGFVYGVRCVNEKFVLRKVNQTLRELIEVYEAGMIPESDRVDELRFLQNPWGELISSSLKELRQSGASVLPTLRRIEDLSLHVLDRLGKAHSKSAQALFQVFTCAALVPVFGLALFFLMEPIQNQSLSWLGLCSLAVILSLLGACWLLALADQARWGGLPIEKRNWILEVQVFGERVLSYIRSGTPPDLAYAHAYQHLAKHCPKLALQWGGNIWSEDSKARGIRKRTLESVLLEVGREVKTAIQIGLMEGRGSQDRIDAALRKLRTEVDLQVEKELNLLQARALKPLFVCVAPALFGLMVSGLFLSWKDLSGGF